MKQLFIFLTVFAFLGEYFLNAQELIPLKDENMIMTAVVEQLSSSEYRTEKFANAKNNWISTELSLGNIGLRYERMLSQKISLGVNVFYNLFWDRDAFGIDASLHFYPWGKTFFIGCALGYQFFSSTTVSQYHFFDVTETEAHTTTFSGPAITPEIGWKIDVGNVGGFYLLLGCAIVFPVGNINNTVEITGNSFAYQKVYFGEFIMLASRIFYVGMGFAF